MGSTLGQSTAQFTLAGLTLLLAGLAQAQFGPQVNILGQDPELPEEAVTADLDGDGLDDILFTSNGDGTIGWYRNLDGAGTYGALRSIRQGPQHSVITAADLDGDGDTDVLTAESIGNRVIWIENENGDGSLWTARVIGFSFDGLSDPTDVAAADYDLDGDIDVFAVHNNSSDRDGRVGVYTNNGFADPSFQQQRIAIVGRFPTDIKLADLSGNGRPDILLSADVGDRVTWIPNNPEGFGAPIDISASQDRPQSVAAADLDGDGDLDVVASSIGDNVVAWYANNLNTATPGFGGLQFIANGPAAPLSIDAGDLDGDGDPDIVVAGSSGNVVTWHENQLDTATPGFNVNRSVSGPLTRPQSVFIANLDGDGDNDVLSVAGNISSSNRENKITFHRNNGAGSFSNRLISEFSQRPDFARTLDMDLDGDTDVLTGSSSSDRLHLSRRTADGDHASELLDDLYPGLFDADVGDIDGDGDPDAMISQHIEGRVSWLANNAAQGGSGFFGAPNPVSSVGSFSRIQTRLADLDADDDLDAVLIRRDQGELVWQANNGLGSFGPVQLIVGDLTNLFRMAIADLDADGLNDIVFIIENGGAVQWLENRLDEAGNPGFAAPASVGALSTPASLALGDIDGDGDIDVAAGSNSSSAGTANIVWFGNQLTASGDWAPASTIHSVDFPRLEPRSIALLDSDNDGDLDLVAGFARGNTISSFQNSNGGSFGGPVTVDAFARNVIQVSGVDLDGDSDQDLLSVERDEDLVAMFENRSPLPELDFGDAPPPFPTLLADDGPRHLIGPLFLGTRVDSEADGQPNATATGDDSDAASNDEDGAIFSGLQVGNDSAALEVVVSSQPAFVTAFVDFNQDGRFDAAAERILDAAEVTGSSASLAFSVPDTALPGESFARVRLSDSAAAIGPTGQAASGEVEDQQVTILPPPELRIDDVRIEEGDSGSNALVFTISLSPASSAEVTVDYASADGSASVADNDYLASSGTATIASGETSTTVSISVLGDRRFETDESFSLQLSNPVGATLADDTGVGRIINDDAQPSIRLTADPASISEAGGSTQFTATLSNPSSEAVTAELELLGSSTAEAGDYAAPDRVFTIPAGATAASLTLTGVDDSIAEGTETIIAAFGSVSNASPILETVRVDLLDNEGTPSITLAASPLQIAEAGGSSTLTVTLDPVSSQDVQLQLLLSERGGAVAADASDLHIAPTELTIAAGQSMVTATLTAIDDALFEGDEPARVTVGGISGNASQGVPSVVDIVIIDDEPAPAPDAALQPQALDFGEQQLDSVSAAQTVFINNNGTALLTVSNFRGLSGADANSFVAFGNCSSVAPGGACNFGVEFRPQREGAHSAAVLVETNDPDSPVLEVALSGIGIAPPPAEDDDGVDADEEAAGPNGGDGNGDGIADNQQDNVASFRGQRNSYATLATPAGTQLRNVGRRDPDPEGRPSLFYPTGFLSFEIVGLTPGACIDVELLVDQQSSSDARGRSARYIKFDEAQNRYFDFSFDGSTGLRNTGTRGEQLLFTLSFCDGQRGDVDGLADGRIMDPGAPAFADEEAAEPSVVRVSQSGAMNWIWLLLGLLATAARSRGQRQAPR